MDAAVLEFVGWVYEEATERLGLARSWRVSVERDARFGTPEVALLVVVAAPGGLRELRCAWTYVGILNDDQRVMARLTVERFAVEVDRLLRDRARARADG